jgi:MFS family permease
VGGILFGHFGDKFGRKKTLVAALMLMGITTVLVGCVPDYDTIGIMAPLCLVVLRFLQGTMMADEETKLKKRRATSYLFCRRSLQVLESVANGVVLC